MSDRDLTSLKYGDGTRVDVSDASDYIEYFKEFKDVPHDEITLLRTVAFKNSSGVWPNLKTKNESEIKYVTVDLVDVINYFSKQFDFGEGKNIFDSRYFVDPTQGKIIFKFFVQSGEKES